MRVLLLSSIIVTLNASLGLGQTCTVTGISPLNWPTNGSGIVCSTGGNAVGKSIVIIPAGFTVVFNDNGDTWTGTRIEVFGTLTVTANVTINSSIVVKNGGRLNITGKLDLGSGAGCGFSLAVGPGGLADIGATGADRLTICGKEIMNGTGPCNNCGGTNSAQCPYNGNPYCEPSGGYSGPTGFGEGGYDATLPVKLLGFQAEYVSPNVRLQWATSMEEKFQKFVIQRSADGMIFEDIGEIPGKGFDSYEIETDYSFEDRDPILGFNYYRLKAIDLDDAYEYFGVKVVKITGSKKLLVYPNPTTGDVISFRLNFTPAESDRIVLLNQLGMEVFNSRVTGLQNNMSFSNPLRTGVYVLRYISKDFEEATRIVIRH
jgi:hypothetical protein